GGNGRGGAHLSGDRRRRVYRVTPDGRAARGRQPGGLAGRPLDRPDGERRPPPRPPRLRVRARRHHRRGRRGRAHGEGRRRRASGGLRRGQADPGAARAHHREQRNGHGDHPEGGEAPRAQGAHSEHLGGLRQGAQDPLQRGGRRRARRDLQEPLGLRRLEDDGRVLRARLPRGVRPAGRPLPALQHRGPAPDGPLRDGRAAPRAPGFGGGADHRLRRRHPAPVLLRRRRRLARDSRPRGPPGRPRARLQRGQHRRGHHQGASRAHKADDRQHLRDSPRPLLHGVPRPRLRGHGAPQAGHPPRGGPPRLEARAGIGRHPGARHLLRPRATRGLRGKPV
ncbi:MAG: dTDP-glucose 4,6-dehydratase, partial [uncultured Rubrobacteraceae bacterium]